MRGEMARPEELKPEGAPPGAGGPASYYAGEAKVATSKAYGNALARLGPGNFPTLSAWTGR